MDKKELNRAWGYARALTDTCYGVKEGGESQVVSTAGCSSF